MAHFAKLNKDNIVIDVVVVNNNVLIDSENKESEAKGIKFLQDIYRYDSWIQTSYNGSFRKNYAGIGYTYDATRDAFIPPKEFEDFILNEDTCMWEPPIPYPTDGKSYLWDGDSSDWIEFVKQ